MIIKRISGAVLVICIAMLFSLSVLTLGAEETNVDIWSVYSLAEDKNGFPYYATPPAHAYTEKGLRVSPMASVESYTVQTDQPYYLDRGLYLEIQLDKPVKGGILVFHIWDQNGFIVSNYHCGSGWEGLLQLNDTESQYLMSAYLEGDASTGEEGGAGILGSMKVKAPVNDDGTVTYSFHLKDDILRINGSVVVGMDEALEFVRSKRPDGSAYFGVSLVMDKATEPIPLTVTAFGLSPETAVVPGTGGILPETGEDSPETIAPAPDETDPPAVETTPGTNPDTTPGTDSDTTPETPPEITPGGEVESDPPLNPPEDGTEEDNRDDEITEARPSDDNGSDASPDDAETETEQEIRNESIRNFVERLENLDFSGCAATLGAGSLGCLSMLAAGYVCVRKKD